MDDPFPPCNPTSATLGHWSMTISRMGGAAGTARLDYDASASVQTRPLISPGGPCQGGELKLLALARHVARSRGSMNVCATSTRRFTTMKIVPAQTVKPITAL